jgi:hypothetical protein
MAQIDKHAPGTFCRVELETTNQDAKSSCGSLFGVYAPPTTVDKSLRFGVLADPQGAVFSLFQS